MIDLRRFASTASSTMRTPLTARDSLASREFITLVMNKQWDTIVALLNDPAIPSQQKKNVICFHNDRNENNTIMEALESGASFEVIKLMIEIAPYIINSKDSNGWNLLHCACYYNASPEIVRFIIRKALPKIWLPSESGMNALHLACRHNTHVEVAKIIICEAPVDVCASRDAEGWSPLHLALHFDLAVELIQLIIEKIPREIFFSKNNEEYDSFHYLCEHTESEKIVHLIMKKSTSIILEAIKNNSNLLQLVSKDLRADENLAKAVIESHPLALEFASKIVKTDRHTVLMAVKKNGLVLQFASEQLRNDRVCELAAVQCNPLALEFSSGKTQEDRSVVREAVMKDGNALQFAGDDLRMDKEIILAAVRTTPSSLRFALGGMNQERDLILATGLYDTERARKFLLPTIVMSCRLSLDERRCSHHSTLFGIFMKENNFFKNFGIYRQHPWSISSCDSKLKSSAFPCIGTSNKCRMIHECNGKPQENKCCWKYNTRCRLEKAKLNGGIVIQISEWFASTGNHFLGPGQHIETEMAAQVDVKIFRVMQNQYADRNPVPFKQQHVSQVERSILKWHRSGRRDMTVTKLHVV